MKVLVVSLLVVLSCSLAEGRLVSKCELRDQLVEAIGNLTSKQTGLIREDILARLVCYVELVSNFNTSAVKHGDFSSPTRLTRADATSSTTQPTPLTEPRLSTRPTSPSQHGGTDYGLFQLSSRLVCSDNTSSSPDICGINCSNLVDDDIHDDITCFLKILTNIEANSEVDPLELKRIFKLIFQDQCRDSVYFAECS